MPSQAAYLVVNERGRHHHCGEHQEDGKNGVAHPFGTALVGVDVDVRHSQR